MRIIVALLALALVSGCALTPAHLTHPADQAAYQLRAAELKLSQHRETLEAMVQAGTVGESAADNIRVLMANAEGIIAQVRPLVAAGNLTDAAAALDTGAAILAELKTQFGSDGQEIADYVVIAVRFAAGEMRTRAALAQEFGAP